MELGRWSLYRLLSKLFDKFEDLLPKFDEKLIDVDSEAKTRLELFEVSVMGKMLDHSRWFPVNGVSVRVWVDWDDIRCVFEHLGVECHLVELLLEELALFGRKDLHLDFALKFLNFSILADLDPSILLLSDLRSDVFFTNN